MSIYTSFNLVYRDVRAGRFPNEASLRQAFVEALKHELKGSLCNEYIVEALLSPVLDEVLNGRKPDILFSNIVIEVEPPNGDIGVGRVQLHDYMERLFRKVEGEVDILGLVTNGIEAEFWFYSRDGLEKRSDGRMPIVAGQVLQTFCSSKISIVTPDDLIRIFGV